MAKLGTRVLTVVGAVALGTMALTGCPERKGPAEKAGLQRGDRLIELAGREVRDINDMMFVLRSVHPGDKATAVVMRGGKRLELAIVFGESRRM